MQEQENIAGGVARAGVHLLGAARCRAKNIRCETLGDFPRVIGRAAIDNDQLDIRMVSKLAQSNREVYFFVQSRNDDADDHESPSSWFTITRIRAKNPTLNQHRLMPLYSLGFCAHKAVKETSLCRRRDA